MLLQDMLHVFSHIVQFKGEELGLRLEVAHLEDKQHAARATVMTIGYGAFFGREAKEMYALVVVELWSPVQILDLLVFQNLESVFVSLRHRRSISSSRKRGFLIIKNGFRTCNAELRHLPSHK